MDAGPGGETHLDRIALRRIGTASVPGRPVPGVQLRVLKAADDAGDGKEPAVGRGVCGFLPARGRGRVRRGAVLLRRLRKPAVRFYLLVGAVGDLRGRGFANVFRDLRRPLVKGTEGRGQFVLDGFVEAAVVAAQYQFPLHLYLILCWSLTAS